PLAAGLAEGLAAVHTHGLGHRDLKPGNVLLAADGPRLIDFGIAKAAEDTHLTHTGAVIGTPGFMAPEQVVGNEATEAADIFALGAVLVYAATGEGPFGQGATHAVNYRVVHEEPDLSRVPGPFTDLVAACLHKDPDARPEVPEIMDLVPGHRRADPSWLPGDVTTLIDERQTVVASDDGTTARYTEPGATRPEDTHGARPSGAALSSSSASSASPGPRAPEPDPRAPEIFQLGAGGVRAAEAVKSVAWGLLSLAAIGAAIFVVGLLLSGGNVDASGGFASGVLSSPFFWGIGVVAVTINALDQGKLDAYGRLVVGEQGISLVDNRGLRLRDRSVTVPWGHLKKVRVRAEADLLALQVAFTARYEPDAKWVGRHSMRSGADEHTLCHLKVRKAEDAAVLPRLRSALAGFAGERYSE
ncbi:protein kinase domain-containing protein, partial [Streptomyces sp. NPDC005009]